jgi:hypothetical protein
MNLVERFFRDLSQQAILPGSFGSVRQLVDAIMQYLARHNLNPKRYVWRAKGEEILARRACRCERSPGASRQRTPEQMFAEIRRLQKENEYLKRQREILNKAMSILGEEPNPGMRTPENFAAFWEEEIHLF